LPLCFATGQGNTAPAVSTPASFDGAGDDMTEHARSCVAVVALAVVSACTPLSTNNLREQLTQLAAADTLMLEISAPNEAPRRYEPWKADPTGLRRFVERTAASAP